ncbi:MAG: hypothetical protein KY468_08485 [Armatimonadetes bacterium]|nr:hypothetical protein [Armatimonadota bacterium]
MRSRIVHIAVGAWVALLLMAASVVPAHAARMGDSNGDGLVDVRDAIDVLNMALDPPLQAASRNIASADLSPEKAGGGFGDGRITVGDAVVILRLVVGLEPQSKYASPSGTGDRPEVQPAIHFQVSTSRLSYDLHDAIPFTISLYNGTDQSASWNFNSGCQVELSVKNADGNVLWAMPQVCAQAFSSITLKPGEEVIWKYVWYDDARSGQKTARVYGTYTATARLISQPGDPSYESSVTFTLKENTEPIPLPGDGTPTFNLVPGRTDHYVQPSTDREETIRFVSRVEKDGHAYTLTSLTPDGARDVLLRLDNEGNLRQSTGGRESVRLKLHAKTGESWTFDYGTTATATLASRNASLKTPGGIYNDLLEFSFFVGPDLGWTEWVHPTGFWVGYDHNTIAGPVEFRVTNRDFTDPVPPKPDSIAKLTPESAQVKGGETLQFQLTVYDKNGAPVTNPAPVTWGADEAIGTVNARGLFTARSSVPTDAARGRVWAETTMNGTPLRAEATVTVGTFNPPPPSQEVSIEPGVAMLKPGAQQQFQLVLKTDVQSDSVKWSAYEPIGTIDANGLFTARSDITRGIWGTVTVEARFGDALKSDVARVYVGPDAGEPVPGPEPPPTPAYRLEVEPMYATPAPGGQVQYHAKLVTSDGKPVDHRLNWYADPFIGTITPAGLFTASQNRGNSGMVKVQAVGADGKLLAEGEAKVSIPGEATQPPPDTRLAYLQGGSLRAGPSPVAGPDVAIQVEIKGDMPDPAWAYDHTDVKVDGETIYLYPVIRRVHDGPAPAVLKPFETTVQVRGLVSGKTYTVIAIGHDVKLTAQAKA